MKKTFAQHQEFFVTNAMIFYATKEIVSVVCLIVMDVTRIFARVADLIVESEKVCTSVDAVYIAGNALINVKDAMGYTAKNVLRMQKNASVVRKPVVINFGKKNATAMVVILYFAVNAPNALYATLLLVKIA